jgi:hypothetical protein
MKDEAGSSPGCRPTRNDKAFMAADGRIAIVSVAETRSIQHGRTAALEHHTFLLADPS